MAAEKSSGGVGFFCVIVGFVGLGWVLEHIRLVATAALVVATVAALAWWLNARATRLEVRRRCPVCSDWKSVIMTDLDATTRPRLCPDHGARLRRIEALEAALLDPDIL